MPRAEDMDLRYTAQRAHDIAVGEIERELRALEVEFASHIEAGDDNLAASALQQYNVRAAERERLERLSNQSPYTEREAQLLQSFPSIARDPARMQQVQAAANQAIAAGYQRDSDGYLAAVRGVLTHMVAGTNDVDLTPNEAVRIANTSKYAQLSPIDANTYNAGVHKIQQLKALGLYRG
jgi:hypothetical protein